MMIKIGDHNKIKNSIIGKKNIVTNDEHGIIKEIFIGIVIAVVSAILLAILGFNH